MSITADKKERLASLAGVGLLHLLLGWALLLGLTPGLMREVGDSLAVFDVREAPPPPPAAPIELERKAQEPRPAPQSAPAPAPAQPKGASAPPRRPVAAAPSKRARDVAPPVAAGIVPSSGGQVSKISGDPEWMGVGGGGDEEGSGTGSGNAGTGSGGGGSGGNGSGGNGSGGNGSALVSRAKLSGGKIVRKDYPRAAGGAQGSVEANLTVSPAGTVTRCQVARSSGNRVLDETTCRLIRERFRFTPARDAQGRPVADEQGWRQTWWRN